MRIRSAGKEELAFYVVLTLGAALRLNDYANWSLSNDELSAIMRVNYDSFSELIFHGVKNDGHPAATQVFEYFWIKLFGNSAASVRFPFVVFGILGLYYSYRTASAWFGKFPALLALAFMAVSQYFILYSQIARPYAMGFFLIMLFTYNWTLYLQESSKFKISLGLVIAATLAILTHYFASLSVILFLIMGIFLCPKNRLKSYLINLSLIVLLCLPHLPLTLHHLEIGGVGDWLPKPEPDFILEFINYISNEYWPFQTALLILPILSIALYGFHFSIKWKITALVSSVVPFLLGYYYSVHVNPVLQFSVLIFSFPFFIMFFFSLYRSAAHKKVGYIFLSLIVILGAYGCIVQKNFYNNKKFANFREVSKNLQYYEDSLSSKNLLIFMNSNNHDYFEYYFKQQSNYDPDIAIKQFLTPEDVKRLSGIIDSTNSRYVAVAWANGGIPFAVHEIIKRRFSNRIVHKHYFNSEFSIYTESEQQRETAFKKMNRLEVPIDHWEVKMDDRDTTQYVSAKHSYHVKTSTLYAMTYRSTIGEIFKEGKRFLTIDLKVKMNKKTDCKLVVQVNRDGENVDWIAYHLQDFYTEGEWFNCTFVYERKKHLKNSDAISIYLWNPEKSELWVDDFNLRVFKDSDYDYYDLYEDRIQQED